MPNWCANSLKLVATTAESEKKLAEIVQELSRSETAKENPKFCELIKPVPAALHITAGYLGDTKLQAELEAKQQANLKLYGYSNWYEFCNAEWGCKWDIRTLDDDSFVLDGNAVTIFFDTPWAPPMGIYPALENMGFIVEATYIEQGCDYIGYYTKGNDTCTKFSSIYEFKGDDEEEDWEGQILAVESFFEGAGFDHQPSNFGG